jgi:molybdate transport system substrate-binding protein
MKRLLVVGTLLSSLCLILGSVPCLAEPGAELTVSAAVSLKNAFEEIGQVFEKKFPGKKIRFNFGGSGDLARQIEAGAPVDVFASAAQKDMDDLDRNGLILSGSRMNFAGNTVVLVKPARSVLRIDSFEDLRRPVARRIVIGNPKTVPAGRYAEEVLKHLGLWEALKEKFIFAEHVRQALDYVARNEVDAAIVYLTDAMAGVKEVKVVMKAPEGSHQPVVYPIGVVKGSRQEPLAKELIALIAAGEGQTHLRKYGFEKVK